MHTGQRTRFGATWVRVALGTLGWTLCGVVVDYGAQSGTLKTWHGGPYDRMVYHSDASQATDSIYFTFTPDPGVGVCLGSFDVQTENSGAKGGQWWVRSDSLTGPILAQGIWNVDDSGSYPLHTIDVSAAGICWGTVVLQINQALGAKNVIGFDNINFDQVVPEPSSLSLGGIGLAAGGFISAQSPDAAVVVPPRVFRAG